MCTGVCRCHTVPAQHLLGALGSEGDGVGEGEVGADDADVARPLVRQVDVLLRHHSPADAAACDSNTPNTSEVEMHLRQISHIAVLLYHSGRSIVSSSMCCVPTSLGG